STMSASGKSARGRRLPGCSLGRARLKIREGGSVHRLVCWLALGVTVEGERDVLGIWFQETEGATFWMQVLSELSSVQDILICCVDELKSVPDAIEAISPATVVQTCLAPSDLAQPHFPNEEAAKKLIYLAITNAVPAWTRTRNWTTALLAFKIDFG